MSTLSDNTNYPAPRKFTFLPDTRPETEYRPRKRNASNSWCAPEHGKFAKGMERKFPVDELGVRIPGRERELVVDPRPNIMIPERPTIRLAL